MESSRKFFPAIAVLLLLVVTTEVVPSAEARECETASNRFKGMCMMVANCANVCLTEGFSGGKCSGFRRRCMCTKEC
ncbi:defensin Ec-AMP-D1-like [Oryza brachyantha]|uniref:Knottins-like domain-containing protein n=1 Tax=Oryza brachyantha TaxID=4533 RepID=J3LVV5_ORYBR|nr:defensin Ec-AMP-D1-like [Oryza brachyantha]